MASSGPAVTLPFSSTPTDTSTGFLETKFLFPFIAKDPFARYSPLGAEELTCPGSTQ